MATELRTNKKLDGLLLLYELHDIRRAAADAIEMVERLSTPADQRVVKRAMSLCERCAGLPELSINRCPGCRCLQELISG